MKTNLKNKPIAIPGKRNKLLTPFGYEVNKWFEDFERELREIMNKSFSPCRACKTPEARGGCRICIREILGDDEE